MSPRRVRRFNLRVTAPDHTPTGSPPAQRTHLSLMPHYFLHLWTGRRLEQDPEGLDAPDLASAHAEAAKVAHELYADWRGEPDTDVRAMAIEIADETGDTVLTVPFPDSDR